MLKAKVTVLPHQLTETVVGHPRSLFQRLIQRVGSARPGGVGQWLFRGWFQGRRFVRVGALGSGLSDTVSGVAGGLGKVASGTGQTAAAPFTSAETEEGEEGGKGVADSAVESAGDVGGKAKEAAGSAKDAVEEAGKKVGGEE